MNDTFNELLKIIRKNGLGKGGEIKINSNLSEIGMDSMEFINLIVEIENYFNIELPDEYLQIKKIGTMGNLVKVIDSLR